MRSLRFDNPASPDRPDSTDIPMDRALIDASLAAGSTVVTPNRRFARDLKRGFDLARQQRAHRGQGPVVWATADVLPWSAWLIRSRDEAVGMRPEVNQPVLLNALQQRVLWEQVIAASGAAGAQRAVELLAASAASAWALLHQHDDVPALMRNGALNEDQRAFAQWCDAYARRLRQLRAIDEAQLPRWLTGIVTEGGWRPLRPVILAGFDRLRPVQRRLIAALQHQGCAVVTNGPEPSLESPPDAWADAVPVEPACAPLRVACADLTAQWRAAAAWARQRLQRNPTARIGIVVPDLHAHRNALTDALGEALAPSQRLDAAVDPLARPFNISLGRPLAGHPLVACAQALLDLIVGDLPIATVGQLLRSPYLAGGAAGEAEWSMRAGLDASLRRAGHWQLSLSALLGEAARTPMLARALHRIDQRLAASGARARPLSAWLALMFDLLRDAGFPGSRTLDSAEYQAHQAWRESLAALATLDELLGALTLPQALARVRRQLAESVFQPESADAAVQVLGVIESGNLRFDHIWIANLSDKRWPPAPQPHPLLPLALQRAWGEPTASAEHALALARQQMQSWLACASEIVFSHPLHEDDEALGPSPLISALAERSAQRAGSSEAADTGKALADPVTPVARVLARDLVPAPMLDEVGPPRVPAAGAQPGGAKLLEDQSACPFRGFAAHRLHATALEAPAPGLDPRARGTLLHDVLHRFWRGLASQQALLALPPGERDARLRAAVDSALDALAYARPGRIGPRLRAVECERLIRLCGKWLEIEAARPSFSVVDLEAQAASTVGGLDLRLKPDRVDRLDNGALVVIDYKTGSVKVADWLGERMAQPQLPLYATMLAARGASIHAIAFAHIRADKTHAVALSAAPPAFDDAEVVDASDEGASAGVAAGGFDALLIDWRARLERLAAGYLAGEAAVAPARPDACRRCDLPALCRLQERRGVAARLGAAADGEEGEGGVEGDDD